MDEVFYPFGIVFRDGITEFLHLFKVSVYDVQDIVVVLGKDRHPHFG